MLNFGKLIDLAKTPDEAKADITRDREGAVPIGGGSSPRKTPAYPYGLCIYLNNETLKKMGLDGDLPDVGDVVHFCAEARVTSASTTEEEDEKGVKTPNVRVELQITKMGVPEMDPAANGAEESKERQSRWYGSGDQAEAGAE